MKARADARSARQPPVSRGVARGELERFLTGRVPRLGPPVAREDWIARTGKIRAQLLSLFFRGSPPGILDAPGRVEWGGVIEPGTGAGTRSSAENGPGAGARRGDGTGPGAGYRV